MKILTGREIETSIQTGRIRIDPFDPDSINANSYAIKLSPTLKVYDDVEINGRRRAEASFIKIPREGHVLEPQHSYFGVSVERISCDGYLPTYSVRSAVARLGIFVNLWAPHDNVGLLGCWMLKLYPINPVRVYAGMGIGQLMFGQSNGETPATVVSSLLSRGEP